MARRFGKFNPRQKRDSKGRWTKGGGSSSKAKSKSGKKPNYKTGRLSNGQLLLSTQDPNKYSKRGSTAGAAAGALIGAAFGTPFAGAGLGVLAGSLVGNSIDQRVARRRINAAEAALRRKR